MLAHNSVLFNLAMSNKKSKQKPTLELNPAIFNCPEPCQSATRWHWSITPQETFYPLAIYRALSIIVGEVKLRSARPLPYSRPSIVTLTLTLPLVR